MLSRRYFLCLTPIALLCFYSIVTAQVEHREMMRPERPESARPRPKPSPTPTSPGNGPIGPSSGGIQAVRGEGAVASATPKPSPTPTNPGTGPIGPSPGGPQAFVGDWRLDTEHSENLSSALKNADTVTWNITEKEEQIVLDRRVIYSPGAVAGAAGAGGMAGGGGMGSSRPSWNTYKLDGREKTIDIPGNRAKLTLKGEWLNDGLSLSRRTTITRPAGEETRLENMRLELSDDGGTMTVKVHTEGANAGPDMKLVFKRSGP